MLINYKFKNFCSFKDEAEFSMKATEAERVNYPENYVSGNPDILKSAVIVGENAGGKSNFIKSLQYLKNFFGTSQSVKSQLEYLNDDYTKTALPLIYKNTAQEFSLEVLVDEVIYSYELYLDNIDIKKESFSVMKNGDSKFLPIFIVERTEEDNDLKKTVENNPDDLPVFKLNYSIKLNPSYEQLKNFLQTRAAKNDSIGLYLSKIALLNVPEAVTFSNWINNTLCFEFAPYSGYELTKDRQSNSEILKIISDSRFLEILKIIDSSITEIRPDNRYPYQNTVIVRQNSEGQSFGRELQSDSAGLKDYFRWAIQIFKVVYENKVLFADEMDRSLNPVLADKIISFINGTDHHGQFIFTTHNVLHLNLNKQMKEQIYFVTKNLSTLHSELYSLADFPDIDYRSDVNLYEFYLRGILGGTILG